MDEVRVLVVDDFPDAAEALAGTLTVNGYTVRTAADGRQAIDMVADFRPHCVLLDVDMPGLDGDELSRQLRERHGDDMVLIAVTGWDEKDQRVHATFNRVDHYLQKPVDPARLRKLLPPL